MDRQRVTELHFITPIVNLPSIVTYGILSHNLVSSRPHVSVAMDEVQAIRAGKVVPNGFRLHDYANLYFDARNPMMFCRKDRHADLTVVRVNPVVLDGDGVVIADGNAASNGTRFFPSPAGLSELNEELVYGRYWTDQDFWSYIEKKRARSAEVLVPRSVPPQHLMACYASCSASQRLCLDQADIAVEVKSDVFFL